MLAIVNIAKSTYFVFKAEPTFIIFDFFCPFIHALPLGIVDSTSLIFTKPFFSYNLLTSFNKICAKLMSEFMIFNLFFCI